MTTNFGDDRVGGMLIVGQSGLGKTHAGMVLANVAADGLNVAWFSGVGIPQDLGEGIAVHVVRTMTETERTLREMQGRYDLVVVDSADHLLASDEERASGGPSLGSAQAWVDDLAVIAGGLVIATLTHREHGEHRFFKDRRDAQF